MFRWHRVEAQRGFEVVVNGQIEQRTPLYVGSKDQVYFVSFAPFHVEEACKALCKEGILHDVEVATRLRFRREDLKEVLRSAGYSVYAKPVQIKPAEYVQGHNLCSELKAAIQTYIQEAGFFELMNHELTTQALHEKIAAACEAAGMAGDVISCAIVPAFPELDLLAQMASKAKKGSGLDDIVTYFQNVMKHRESLGADEEQAKINAQKEILGARTGLKVFETLEHERIAESEQKAKKKSEARRASDQERHARLKAHSAELEFKYKQKRLDEQETIAQKQLMIAEAEEKSHEIRRKSNQADVEIELAREQRLSEIRSGEIAHVLEKVKELPIPDYSGIQTLVTSAGSEQNGREHIVDGLFVALLNKMTGVLESDDRRQKSERA